MSMNGHWQQDIAAHASAAIRELAPEVAVLAGAGASKALGLPIMNEFFDDMFPSGWRDELDGNLSTTDGDFRYWLIRMAYPDPNVTIFDLEQVMLVIQELEDHFLRLQDFVRNGIVTILADYPLPRGGPAKLSWQRSEYGKRYDGTGKAVEKLVAKLREACDSIVHEFNRVFGEPKGSSPDELWFPMLDSLARLTDRAIPLFTTNYDVAFERMTAPGLRFAQTYSIVTGLLPDATAYYTPTWNPANYANATTKGQAFWLFKLHGSSDWCLDGTPPRIMQQANSACTFPNQGDQCLRRPYLSKGRPDVEAEPWFNAQYAALEEGLRSIHLLVVIGFSFRDDAIRELVSNELTKRDSFRVVAVSPDETPSEATDDGNAQLRAMASVHSPNMIWIKERFSRETMSQLVQGILDAHHESAKNT